MADLLETGIHPTTIAQSFQKAATKAVEYLEEMSTPVNLNDRESLLRAAGTSLNSKVSYEVGSCSRCNPGMDGPPKSCEFCSSFS